MPSISTSALLPVLLAMVVATAVAARVVASFRDALSTVVVTLFLAAVVIQWLVGRPGPGPTSGLSLDMKRRSWFPRADRHEPRPSRLIDPVRLLPFENGGGSVRAAAITSSAVHSGFRGNPVF